MTDGSGKRVCRGGARGAAAGDDRLSALPDCLLHAIMSFMKTRQVVQTSGGRTSGAPCRASTTTRSSVPRRRPQPQIRELRRQPAAVPRRADPGRVQACSRFIPASIPVTSGCLASAPARVASNGCTFLACHWKTWSLRVVPSRFGRSPPTR
jgi:hypothetical protein